MDNEGTPAARDGIRSVAMALPRPWRADEIAAAVGRPRRETRRRLGELVATDDLLAVDLAGGTYFYSDPVTAFLEGTGGPPEGPSEHAAVAATRRSVDELAAGMPLDSVEALLRYHHAARLVASSRLSRGFDAYAADWDVLVILDTCRIDALRAVLDRLPGTDPSDLEERLSLASQTAEWLCKTFTADRADAVDRTGYVAGNGWAKAVFEDGLSPDDDSWFRDLRLPTDWNHVDGSEFGEIVHAWQRDRDSYSPAVPWAPHPSPEVVTDHAISLARERADLDRLVVHYKQPHAPYTVSAEREGRSELRQEEGAPFDYIAEGGDRTDVWKAYLTDLEAAVEAVAALCRNVDGTVAITADHGEAFGEGNEYGHRPAMLHRDVRRVPWITLEASDEGTRQPDLSADDRVDRDVDAQLEALGYRR